MSQQKHRCTRFSRIVLPRLSMFQLCLYLHLNVTVLYLYHWTVQYANVPRVIGQKAPRGENFQLVSPAVITRGVLCFLCLLLISVASRFASSPSVVFPSLFLACPWLLMQGPAFFIPIPVLLSLSESLYGTCVTAFSIAFGRHRICGSHTVGRKDDDYSCQQPRPWHGPAGSCGRKDRVEEHWEVNMDLVYRHGKGKSNTSPPEAASSAVLKRGCPIRDTASMMTGAAILSTLRVNFAHGLI